MPTAKVSETHLRPNLTGNRSENWDSETLKKSIDANLADLLQNESGIFVKSYGNGSLATVSSRGGSAGHTAILWNGLPLQSPMLGLLDFSLIPTAAIDEAEVQFGGNSAAWGSGAIGGVISLKNEKEDKAFAEIRSTIGSFGLFDQQIKTQLNFGNWKSVTRLFHRQAKNDFTWQVREDLPIKTMTNSKLNQNGILQEFYWSPKTNQQLAIRFWGQNSYKEIPPTSVQNSSSANQRDEALRFSADWKSTGNKIVWQIRSGAFRESILYKNYADGTRAPSHFWNFLGEGEGEYFLNKSNRFSFGASLNQTFAEIESYGSRKNQNRIAAFAGFRQNLNNWEFQLNLRQTLADGKLIPFVPALGFKGKLSKYFSVNGKISRNYRLPTLNDLYWIPGGNSDLLPESGWGQELGLSTNVDNAVGISYSVTGFNRKVNNWIMWSPDPTKGYWSAQNITSVHSRGIEQRINANFQFKTWKFKLKGGYDFILSTNEIALRLPKIAEGEQLWYVPKNQAFGKIEIAYKNFEINYRHQFTGEVSTPNFSTLDNYHTGNFTAAFTPNFGHRSGRIFFSINNIWDVNYRVIEYRPMPGRHFQIGIITKFLKK